MALYTLTPSSTARSMSSITLAVEPRITRVETGDASSVWVNEVTRTSPTSFTSTLSAWPISDGDGGISRGSGVAPIVLHRRRMSCLERILTIIIPALFRKCSAMSPNRDPDTTTFTPASLIDAICASSMFSSPFEKSLSSVADWISTVPLVSVCCQSTAPVYTATLATSTASTLPSFNDLRKIIPRSIDDDSTPCPGILTTRT
mmetsp:Transcript_30839/g.80704  ORF Transcript_30839/g.80704 Transcript_30839/m.80704 type:complete len:203 (-) Transcript_30839:613-1221(-)